MDNQNITEKLDPRKNDIGDYIEDFMQSDAPQFKGKSKDKIKDMAIAAYYNDRKEAGLKEDTDIIFEGLSEVNLSKYKDTELSRISVAFSDAGVNWSRDKLFRPAIRSLGKELAKRKMPMPSAVKAAFKPAELKKLLGESTLNWARSMRAIEKQQKMANLSPKDKDTLRKIADLMKRANEENLQEMDPRKHVSKKGDGYIVVNKDGKVVKNFDNKDDAEKYAIDNHDALMESVELEETPTPTFMERVKALHEAKKKEEKEEEEEDDLNEFGVNRLKPDRIRDQHGVVVLTYNSSSDLRNAAQALSDKGINTHRGRDGKSLEVDANSKYFRDKGMHKAFDGTKRQRAVSRILGESKMDEEDQEEGNAFGAAVMAAKKKGAKDFIFAGKKYMVKEYVGPALTPANQIAKKFGGKVKAIMVKDDKGKKSKYFYVEAVGPKDQMQTTAAAAQAIAKKHGGKVKSVITKDEKGKKVKYFYVEDSVSEVKEPFVVFNKKTKEVLATGSNSRSLFARRGSYARGNNVDVKDLEFKKVSKKQSVGSTLKESDITELYEETHSVKIKLIHGKNIPALHVQKMTGLKIKKGTVNKFGSDLGMSLEGPLAKVRKFITRIKTGRYENIIQLVDQEPKKESSARSRNPINVIGKVAGKDFQSKIMRMYGDKKLNDAIPFFFMLDTGASKKDAAKLVNTIRDKNLRKDIQDYLSTVKEETETHYEWDLDEAKKLPFKSLEQAWQRTKGDKDKQAKLIKKHGLKNVISNVRPGEIRLGAKNKLQGSKANMTIAGLDKDNNLIFVTNNPLKIYYPKKSQRRPEGIEATPVYESMQDLRVKAIVQELTGADSETLQLFLAHNTFTEESSYTDIRKAYRSFINEIL